MVPARCRCGGLAARCCVKCGNGLNAQGQCYTHPTLDTATVRCVECGSAVCFWHFALGPCEGFVEVNGQRVAQTTVRPRCFPSCKHEFKQPETRPTTIPIAAANVGRGL